MRAEGMQPVAEAEAEHVQLGALETSLGFMLRIAQLRNFERFYSRFGHLDLKPGEFSILWVVNLNPGIRQGVLAQKLRVKPAHMTKIIRRLEGNGIIARHIPDGDRRSVELSLTERGQEFVEERQADFFGADNYNDTDLTPEEKRQLAALLKKYCGTEGWVR
ncbi:MarR family winged helix-turn-helix transcriptional regulator [Pseudoroseicyclus sp. H15]